MPFRNIVGLLSDVKEDVASDWLHQMPIHFSRSSGLALCESMVKLIMTIVGRTKWAAIAECRKG